MSYRADKQVIDTHTHTHTHTDRHTDMGDDNTRRPKLASGKNCSNSSVLAMEILQSCTKPSILLLLISKLISLLQQCIIYHCTFDTHITVLCLVQYRHASGEFHTFHCYRPWYVECDYIWWKGNHKLGDTRMLFRNTSSGHLKCSEFL